MYYSRRKKNGGTERIWGRRAIWRLYKVIYSHEPGKGNAVETCAKEVMWEQLQKVNLPNNIALKPWENVFCIKEKPSLQSEEEN